MKIALITDAWYPQVNGVVRTLKKTTEILEGWGHEVLCVNPSTFKTFPLPTYPDIRLPIAPGRKLRTLLDNFGADAYHIATEGTLGWAARSYCLKRKLDYTTAYHTRFPEYVRLRAPIPLTWSYAFMHRFHDPAVRTMVATDSMREELEAWNFKHIVKWSRGVDIERFRPLAEDEKIIECDEPVFMYIGRVAVEKNIEAFLKIDLPGRKYVVGGGPALDKLRAAYPDVVFTGYKENGELARHVGSADVMVFPSLTDTFGLVMLEAMATGAPVAAFPVAGPKDVVQNGVNGYLDEDLRAAALKALEVDRASCRTFAEGYSWEACTRQFLDNLSPCPLGEDTIAS
ncbi:MAG: glycosyltransferase family 4 protein [Gammaproteobacteria bacterium]